MTSGIRRVVLAMTALVLCLGPVTPAIASAGPTRLSDGTVSDRAVTTQTPITFTVGYRNREGSPADWVHVRIGGTVHPMARTSTEAWKSGVTFSWRGTLPAGNHTIAFEAMSRDRFSDTLAAGTVTITVPPTPRPTPTPAPTPRPTAQPTPPPTPEPSPTPRPTASARPTATARATATPTPRSTATARPTSSAGTEPSGVPTPNPGATATPGSSDPAPGGSPSPSDKAVAIVVAGGDTSGSDAGGTGPRPGAPGSGGTSGPGAGPGRALAAFGTLAFGRPALSELGLVFTLATTSTVVGAAFALSLFGKRRRDGEAPAPDDVLADYAATGVAVATADLAGDGRDRSRVTPPALEDELAMPRWRRPSLLEARKADPVRNVVSPQRLTFDHGLVGPLDGRERRLIGYSLVRLLDRPDELRGAEIGFVDQGDEVQLLEKSGVYWLVLCPDGREGWLHKMTLGERVGQASGADAVSPPVRQQATATMTQAAETWTMGEDVDGDILTAYLEQRRRG